MINFEAYSLWSLSSFGSTKLINSYFVSTHFFNRFRWKCLVVAFGLFEVTFDVVNVGHKRLFSGKSFVVVIKKRERKKERKKEWIKEWKKEKKKWKENKLKSVKLSKFIDEQVWKSFPFQSNNVDGRFGQCDYVWEICRRWNSKRKRKFLHSPRNAKGHRNQREHSANCKNGKFFISFSL